jgi:hypothetical protein
MRWNMDWRKSGALQAGVARMRHDGDVFRFSCACFVAIVTLSPQLIHF